MKHDTVTTFVSPIQTTGLRMKLTFSSGFWQSSNAPPSKMLQKAEPCRQQLDSWGRDHKDQRLRQKAHVCVCVCSCCL